MTRYSKEEIRKFGREAPKLREEAMQAFHAKKYDGAERKMRDAVQKCPPAGKKEMERELAMMLVAEVVETVNAAVKSLEDEPGKTVNTCGAGLKKLEEASRLDPSAKQITKHVESLRKLEAQAREEADSLRKFGRETPKLRGEAAKAYEANQHDLAEKKLREAIQKCPPAGKPDLQRELAIVLVASANAAAEPAFRDDRLSSEAAIRLCDDAIAKMEEAGRLDPSEQEITKQLRQLRDYVSSLRTFGREAPKHRRLAMEAFKADNYAAAAQHLRKAINHCPAAGRGDLERELSVILSQWAVRDANAAAEQKNSAATLGEARNRLLEAVSLDAQNENAKTSLAAVERMLSPPSPEEVADEIWQAIRNKLFPAHVTPKEDMCKTMLKFAVEHYPPQEVVSRFVELVKQNPSAFVE